MFPIPALTAELTAHGFAYRGFVVSKAKHGSIEAHRFARAGYIFRFDFAGSFYDEGFIGVGRLGVEDGRERVEYLSFFLDYATERNALVARGMTQDEALAASIGPHIEEIVRLVAVTHASGGVIPLAVDRILADALHTDGDGGP